MPINVENLSVAELENLVRNHRIKHATAAPVYLEALQELERRQGKGLDFEKTLVVVRQAVKAHRYLSYKELADVSGANWNQVHYAIGAHLWRLVEYSQLKFGILLSAIVVNKSHVQTGMMEATTLKGFIAAARDLGYPVGDEAAFLKEQQERVFNWAAQIDLPTIA